MNLRLSLTLSIVILLSALHGYCQDNGQLITGKMYTGTKSKAAETYFDYAEEALNNENYPMAIANLKRAIKEDPDFIDAYDNLGVAYKRSGNLDSAEYNYVISVKKYPQGRMALQNLGVVEGLRGNYDKAIGYYKKCIELDANDPESYYGLALMYLHVRNYPEALEHINKAEKLYRANNSSYIGDCYYIKCLIYLSAGDKAKAKKYADMAMKEGKEIDAEVSSQLK